MRALRLAPALAALVLAACSVDVEGAPCRAAWQAGDCPDGQACGNDLRCSTRALSCGAAAAHCVPDRDARACDGEVSTWCSAVDPVCGRWVAERCASEGMRCGLRDPGAGRCECPDPDVNTSVLVADAAQGSPDSTRHPFPRGVGPPRCRFASLWDALAWTSIYGIAQSTVAAMDSVFADTRVPIVVRAGVTLAAADPAHPPTLRGSPAAASGPLLLVEGILDGFRIQGGGATGIGVQLACRGRLPEARRVSVDGGGVLGIGILVGATGITDGSTGCGARVLGASVTGSATALSLEPDPAGVATVLGGSFGGNGDGIRVRRGTVIVEPDPATSTTKVRVAGNGGTGVLLDSAFLGAALDATLQGLDVSGNGGAGVSATGNPFPASARVRIRASDVHGNGKVALSRGTLAQAAGGVLLPALAASMSLFELSGSRVWSNAGDQVVIFASPTVSTLGVPGCGATSSWIGCAGTGASIANPSSQWLDVYGTLYGGYSGNVRSAGAACTGAEPGFPAAPACE